MAVVSPGVVGQYSSVIIDQFGDIRISYYDSTNGDLKVARMATPYSNVWSTIRVDSTGTVGAYTSISHTPGPDEFGNIQVSYYDATSGNLKIAREDAWKSWSIETVDSSVNNAGKYSAMATGSDLHIVYYDVTYGDLKYAVR